MNSSSKIFVCKFNILFLQFSFHVFHLLHGGRPRFELTRLRNQMWTWKASGERITYSALISSSQSCNRKTPIILLFQLSWSPANPAARLSSRYPGGGRGKEHGIVDTAVHTRIRSKRWTIKLRLVRDNDHKTEAAAATFTLNRWSKTSGGAVTLDLIVCVRAHVHSNVGTSQLPRAQSQ